MTNEAIPSLGKHSAMTPRPLISRSRAAPWSHVGDGDGRSYNRDIPVATIVPTSRSTPAGLEPLEPRLAPWGQQHGLGLGPYANDGMRQNRQATVFAEEKEECRPKASVPPVLPLPLQFLLPSSIPLLSSSPTLALEGSNRPLYDQLQDMTVNHRCHYGPLLLSSDRSLYLRQPDGASLLRRLDSDALSAAAHRPQSETSRAVRTDERALACRPHHHQRLCLPCKLACPGDAAFLTKFQVFLRLNIEAFCASDDDVGPHKTGRNKRITLHQVGIRCRHCAHVPSVQRKKGAVYFPATTLGFYQAAQNMSSTHFMCGACPDMPPSIQAMFTDLLSTKTSSNHSKVGGKYWKDCVERDMGLINTDCGVFVAKL